MEESRKRSASEGTVSEEKSAASPSLPLPRFFLTGVMLRDFLPRVLLGLGVGGEERRESLSAADLHVGRPIALVHHRRRRRRRASSRRGGRGAHFFSTDALFSPSLSRLFAPRKQQRWFERVNTEGEKTRERGQARPHCRQQRRAN